MASKVDSVQAFRDRMATTKILFAAAAGLSCLVSIGLWFTGDQERGLFVGLWVPSILSAGSLLIVGERDE